MHCNRDGLDIFLPAVVTGSDPEVLKFFVQAELQHCRWAMIGTLGILGAEVMTKMGLINAPEWFVAGEQVKHPRGCH